MLGQLTLYTFVITSKQSGRVLDMGTYYNKVCSQDTATDSPKWRKGNRYTLTKHNDDGSFSVVESYTIQGPVNQPYPVSKED